MSFSAYVSYHVGFRRLRRIDIVPASTLSFAFDAGSFLTERAR